MRNAKLIWFLPVEVRHGDCDIALCVDLSSLGRSKGLRDVRLATRALLGGALDIATCTLARDAKCRLNQSVRGNLESEGEEEGEGEEDLGEHGARLCSGWIKRERIGRVVKQPVREERVNDQQIQYDAIK